MPRIEFGLRAAAAAAILLAPMAALAQSVPFDTKRGFPYCASMCLQLGMQVLRHQVPREYDMAEEVMVLCREQCGEQGRAEGLAEAEMLSIMTALLSGLQKPSNWSGPPAD